MYVDQVFLTLYRELYYRHIYARLTPTWEHRLHSYENYCDLFNYILSKFQEQSWITLDWSIYSLST